MNIKINLLFIISLLLLESFIVKAQFYSGYSKDISGEILRYESQQPDADSSLLVRSEKFENYIEWHTAKVPLNFDNEHAEFILIAGIDVNAEDNHQFEMYINNQKTFSFRNPVDTLSKDWNLLAESGIKLHFKGIMFDKYGDLFGYMFLRVPKSQITPGEAVKIKVVGESANSRSWFMVFRYNAEQKVKFIEEQAIITKDGLEHQIVRTDVLHFGDPCDVNIKIGDTEKVFPLKIGFNLFRIDIPRLKEPEDFNTTVTINESEIFNDLISLSPPEEYILYLLPHSHNDIGYTHVQSEVEQIQWQNFRDAIKYARNTKDYPSGSQFKWSVEVMWAVESYLKNASNEDKNEFIQAVQNGWIELNAFYANLLTELCRPEELYHMMKTANDIEKVCDVDVTSAMITDIPGYSWSLIPVMAQCGVKYFSIGTNTFHRIGNIIEALGDKPFYWESPSGEEKVLCWLHGKGYSEFHTGLAYMKLQNKLKEQLIFDYLNELKQKKYPYDIVTMRYNIGSDNGPPDPYLSDIVKTWNELYISPKIVISTVDESFKIFEEEYGNTIPTIGGNLTGYWEDGALSSARETSINLASAERLSQAEVLQSLSNPDNFPNEKFDEAWKNILLYTEHTWGSWNSVSEPLADFTLQQWETKKSFALTADSISRELLQNFSMDDYKSISSINVLNLNSWERTDLVRLPDDMNLYGEKIYNEHGDLVKSQKLSTGELIFIAQDIPAFGSKKYFVKEGATTSLTIKDIADPSYQSDQVSFEIDKVSGNISKLSFNNIPWNVNDTATSGINEYIYVDGRNPSNSSTNKVSEIRIKEIGPVLTSFIVISEAPGCEVLKTKIAVINGINRLDISNTINKSKIFTPEGVHFSFPFNIPNAEIRINSAIGYYQPGKDQLPGSNKNFFTVNRWVDISNDDHGLTWVSKDAPIIEIGQPTMDAIEFGWMNKIINSQTIVSYVMNNYWETNYKASQDGKVTFRYSIIPHQKFNPVQSEKWGIEQHQPLIIIPSNETPLSELPFTFENQNIIITSLKSLAKGKLLVKFYNPNNKNEILTIKTRNKNVKTFSSDPFGNNTRPIDHVVKIPPFGVRTFIFK